MLALSEWQFLLGLTTGVEIRKGRLVKLLYTDMSQDLTEILTEQATSYAQKGKEGLFILPLMPCHLRRSVRSWNTCLSQHPLRLR